MAALTLGSLGTYSLHAALHEQQTHIFDSFNVDLYRYSSNVVLGGMLDDGVLITTDALNLLVNINCVFQIQIHVMLGKNQGVLYDLYQLTKDQIHPQHTCAPFHISTQPAYISELGSRIERLSLAREQQRAEIKGLMFDFEDLEKAVVVLADLDLAELPVPGKIFEHALDMMLKDDVDVLCSAGVIKNYEHEEEGYYDTFATVLLPDTFVFSIAGRQIQEIRPEEDPAFILGKGFTNVDLLKWLKKQGGAFSNEMKPVQVKSCFGGLAMYRASTWLSDHCAYDMVDPDGAKYANRLDQSSCEHVAFNGCIKTADPSTNIAIQPDLRTRWQKPESEKHPSITKNYAIAKFPSLQAKIKLEYSTAADQETKEIGHPKNTEDPKRARNLTDRNLNEKHTLSGGRRANPPRVKLPTNDVEFENFGSRQLLPLSSDTHAKEAPNDAPLQAKLPRAIVHVGPRNTGSSAIQSSIGKYSAEFENDNYVYLASSNVHFFSHCFAHTSISDPWVEKCVRKSDMLDKIVKNISLARQEHKNIVISSESFDSIMLVDPTKLKELLQGFDVHVVVTYRRFFDWITSNFDQAYRHYQGGWHDWRSVPAGLKNIASYLSDVRVKAQYAQFYAPEVYRVYKAAGFKTQILNYHSGDDIVSSFFCLEELNAPSACTAVQENHREAPIANRAATTAYDEIAIAAYKHGLIDASRVPRYDAREALKYHFEKTKGPLPQICVADDVIQQIEDISLMSEALLVPGFYSSSKGEGSLRLELETSRTTKMCSVDAEKVLEDLQLRQFISTIGRYNSQSYSSDDAALSIQDDVSNTNDDPTQLAWLMSFPK
jgi:hypothetical protein